jgi:hypothetical protein
VIRETETYEEMVARVRKANARLSSRPRRDPSNIETELRQVLAELETLSHGSTQSFAAAPGAGSDESYGCPPGDSRPPHLIWRNEWDCNAQEEREGRRTPAQANERREEILRHARDELVAHRKRDMAKAVVIEESTEELESRVVEVGKGWTVEQTARECRCTPTFVRRARLKAGAHPVTGVTPEGKPEPKDQRERCRELAGNGMTERQIVWLTKLPKTTVRRILGRAA